MDIRKWLNGPKGLTKEPKLSKVKSKNHLDSSDDDEPMVTENKVSKVTPKREKVKSGSLSTEEKENRKQTTAVTPSDFFNTPKKKEIPKTVTKSTYFENSNVVTKPSPENKSSPKSKKKRKAEESVDEIVKKTKKIKVDSITNIIEQELTAESNEQSETKLPNEETSKTTEDKKKFNYFKYKAKLDAGPKNPGSKPLPVGADNCLEGITFVLTGTGDSLGRDETKQLIERYSGKVTSAVSGKTGYLVVGEEPGESKVKKAKEKSVKIIDEDGLFEIIKTKAGKKSKYEIAAEKEAKAERNKTKESPKKFVEDTKSKIVEKSPDKTNKIKVKPTAQEKGPKIRIMQGPSPQLWVDKYKPATLGKIVGQSGAASCSKKLLNWLRDWQKHQGVPKEQRPKIKWSGKGFDDPTGASLRAALLSGPPGVGKTTSALMVAKELGMDVVEFNASDTRSKKSLSSIVRDASGQYSISSTLKENSTGKGKKVLIMDEVDGMAGNEDRGGIQELIQIIKTSQIPIICLCNDRQHMKIRSLAGHCFDLRFQKPRVEQITGAMMSICFKEGFKISAPAVQNIIRACNQDIRQTINTLSMMASKNQGKKIEYDDVQGDARDCKKDLKLGPFDVARLIFQPPKDSSKFVSEKIEYFFEDYTLIPKFNFENYPSIRPNKHTNTRSHLKAMAESASAFSYSNLAENKIMKNQAWGLLQTQAVFSSVIPCTKLTGSMSKMIDFPRELGKISTTNKNARLSDMLKFHTSLKCKSNRLDMVTMFAPTFRENLTTPLIHQSKGNISDGVDKVIDFLDQYDLTKDDMESILELSQWPNSSDPMKLIDSKTKAALTRTYNKLNIKRSYKIDNEKAKKATKKKTDTDGDFDEELVEEESDEDMTAYQKKNKGKTKTKTSKKGKK